MPKGKSYGYQSGVDKMAAPFSGKKSPSMAKGGRASMQSASSAPKNKGRGGSPKGNQSGVQSHRY